MDTMIKRKVAIVGDGSCGKSSLLHVFCKGNFPEAHVPSFQENWVTDVEVDGARIELTFSNASGQEIHGRPNSLAYIDSHAVVVCFAIDSPESFENVREKWIPEVKHLCPNVYIILVGCKQDLRDDSKTIEELQKMGRRLVTREEAMEVKQKTGGCWYLECSARTGYGVPDVLKYAAKGALTRPCGRPKRRKSTCILL